jgi:hypothetical protein
LWIPADYALFLNGVIPSLSGNLTPLAAHLMRKQICAGEQFKSLTIQVTSKLICYSGNQRFTTINKKTVDK